MNKQRLIDLTKKYYSVWMPLLVFALLCVVKMVTVLPLANGPIAFGDELGYKKYSLQWFTQHRQLDPHYPMMYPLSITFAFLFDDWYMAMKILNILYSSSVVFVVYAIARLYLDRNKSTLLMLVSASIPFHFLFPSMIMSENLFFSVFLLAIFLTLWEGEGKKKYFVDVLLGVMLTVACLTRYIAMMAIPVCAFVWVMKQLSHKEKWRAIFGRGFLIVCSMVITFIPWYLNNYPKYDLKEMIGFGIAKKTNPEQLTLERLALTGTFYLAYFVILATPVIIYLFYSFREIEWKNLFGKYNQLWVMVYGLTATFFVAVTRHSWRAAYNYPTYWRIMGRYLICFPLLYIILAYVTKEKMDQNARMRDNRSSCSGIWFTVGSVIAYGMFVFAYLLDVKGVFYPLKNGFLSWKAAFEGNKFSYFGDKCLIIMAVVLFLIVFLQVVKNEKVRKYSTVVFTVVLILFQTWGLKDYFAYSYQYRADNAFESMRTMNEIMMRTEDLQEDCEICYDIVTPFDRKWEKKYLSFFGNINYATPVARKDVDCSKPFYVVCDETSYARYEGHVIREIGRFERFGMENILLFVDGRD